MFKNRIFCFLFAMIAVLSIPQSHATTSIPQKIHFCYGLWDDGDLPPYFSDTVKLWKQQGWDVHVWNRKEVDQLLSRYPELHQLSSTFIRKVQKADLARYVIIYECGGFYIDLDCRPEGASLLSALQNFYPETDAVFFVETTISRKFAQETRSIPIRQGKPEHLQRIANFAFGAAAGHPILLKVLELLQYRCLSFPTYNDDYDVLFKTGPDCMTECVQMLKPSHKKYNALIVEHNLYLNHSCTGTWRAAKDAK